MSLYLFNAITPSTLNAHNETTHHTLLDERLIADFKRRQMALLNPPYLLVTEDNEHFLLALFNLCNGCRIFDGGAYWSRKKRRLFAD